jgi:hypothetical protein
MNITKTIARKIFEACSLHRENYRNLPPATATSTVSEIVDVSDPEKFDDAIAEFLRSKEAECLSEDGLLRTVRRTLVECKELCDSVIDDRVARFASNLQELKLVDYKVIKTFYGATIKHSNAPVKFGALVVYELPRHANEIARDLPWAQHTGFQSEKRERTVIQCLVKARDEVKALERANTAFNAFDLLIAFLLGEEYTQCSIGILRMHFAPHQNAIISSHEGIFSGKEKNKNFNGELEISDLSRFLPDGRDGVLDQFLGIVISPKNELERKISKAVEWTGEAYSDGNRSSSYLKAVIALEALLKIDEKSIITPSIMSSIAEQCAYLNGQSTEECLEIEKKVKTLYGQRSKIAHTGATSVSLKALRDARAFVRDTIWNFIDFKLRLNLESGDAFQSAFRKRKYQHGGLYPLDN